MSWVACAIGPATVSALYSYKAQPLPPPVYFQTCAYCSKAPNNGQKEANCTSCGAPLKEKKRPS